MLIAVALLGLGIFWIASAQREASPQTNGRYVVAAVETDTIAPNGTTLPLHTAIKVDTATGKSWIYESMMPKDGKPLEGWVPISDLQLTH
jgi:hypothetical protein